MKKILLILFSAVVLFFVFVFFYIKIHNQKKWAYLKDEQIPLIERITSAYWIHDTEKNYQNLKFFEIDSSGKFVRSIILLKDGKPVKGERGFAVSISDSIKIHQDTLWDFHRYRKRTGFGWRSAKLPYTLKEGNLLIGSQILTPYAKKQ